MADDALFSQLTNIMQVTLSLKTLLSEHNYGVEQVINTCCELTECVCEEKNTNTKYSY